MTAAELIGLCRKRNIVLSASGDKLTCRGKQATIDELLPEINRHKAGIIAELLRCKPDDELRPIIEYMDDSGIQDEPKKEEEVTWLLDQAIAGLNLSRPQLRTELSSDDIAGIRSGEIPLETVRAYAELWASREPGINLVMCGDCEHFRPDAIGDRTGIGRCEVGAWKPGRGPCLYPNALRCCNDFE